MKKNFKKIPPSATRMLFPMAGNQLPSSRRGVQETFAAFYETWLTKHQEFEDKLMECLQKGEETECTELIAKVLCHYEEFFNEKCKAANADVFLVMSPPWFTSLERTLTWISSFKPTTLFTLIGSKLDDLSSDQTEKIDGIKSETRKLEKELEEKLAKVQESVAGGNAGFGLLMRRYGKLVDGGDEMSELDKTMDELKASMLTVVEKADGLRGSTAKKIMEVLKPLQNVKLLVSFGQLLVRARLLGTQKDAQRAISSNQEGSTTYHA